MRSGHEVLVLLAVLCACDEPDADGAVDSSSGAIASSEGSDDGGESTGAGSSSSTAGEDGSSSAGEVPSSVPDRECPPDSFLDATNFGMPFFSTWCTGCHSADLVGEEERQAAPPELDFDSIDAIRTNLLLAYIVAADEHEMMPPSGGPSAEERVLLGDWLACGAP